VVARARPALRGLVVVVHRWAGLAMAGFVLVAGLTGSLLAWFDELEAALNPALVLAAPPAAQARPLEPLALVDAVHAQLPRGARLPWIPLHAEAGRAVRMGVVPSDGVAVGFDEVFVDPYTGRVLGERLWGDITQGRKNLMTFVYRLHYALALGAAGATLMGIAALVWTLDCLVGFYLTLPARRAGPARARGWLPRWRAAWRLRLRAGAYKRNFDLHRAGSLWTWALLFVLAWSSVAFNLSEVYTPVTRHLLGMQIAPSDRAHVALLASPRVEPRLAPREALAHARTLLAEQAAARGIGVQREDWLGYEPARGLYTYIVTSERDIRERYGGNTRLFFDGDSGEFKGLHVPTGEAAGDTVTTWIKALHMAALWGWPLKLVVCVMGLVVATLAVTGVMVWWTKRAARRVALLRRGRAMGGRATD
jgi:uncharacterized iron-regulated membrane protein